MLEKVGAVWLARTFSGSSRTPTIKWLLSQTDLSRTTILVWLALALGLQALASSSPPGSVFQPIDDFGVGYSSLVQRKNFPIDMLNVDRSFIRVPGNAEDRAISQATIRMGLTLEFAVGGEGVETPE